MGDVMGDVGSKTTCHFSPFNLATCSGGERTARRKGGRSALTKLICLAAGLIQRTTGPGTTDHRTVALEICDCRFAIAEWLMGDGSYTRPV